MKTIGILGGMSWTSSAYYYEQLNHYAQARLGGDNSCKLVLHSFDYQDVKRIFATEDDAAIVRFLLPATFGLIASGAEAIVIACAAINHVGYELALAVGKPVLPMADYAGRNIRQLKLAKAGLLGSRFMMEHGFFKQRLTRHFGIDVVVPNSMDRRMVDSAIMSELVRDVYSDETRAAFEAVVNKLVAAGAECVILGSAELSRLLQGRDQDAMTVPFIDAASLHVQGAVEWAMGF